MQITILQTTKRESACACIASPFMEEASLGDRHTGRVGGICSVLPGALRLERSERSEAPLICVTRSVTHLRGAARPTAPCLLPAGRPAGKKKGRITPAFHAVTAPRRCARRLLVGPSPGGSVQLLDCLDVSLGAYCRHKKMSRSLRWARQLVQLCPPASCWKKQ